MAKTHGETIPRVHQCDDQCYIDNLLLGKMLFQVFIHIVWGVGFGKVRHRFCPGEGGAFAFIKEWAFWPDGNAPDNVYESLTEYFSEQQVGMSRIASDIVFSFRMIRCGIASPWVFVIYPMHEIRRR